MSTPADFSVWGGKKFVLTAVLPGAGGVTYRCCQCEFLFTSRFPSKAKVNEQVSEHECGKYQAEQSPRPGKRVAYDPKYGVPDSGISNMLTNPAAAPLKDSGKDGTYYDIEIRHWTHERHRIHCHSIGTRTQDSIQLCCNDIIEALELDYAQANVLKAIWRQAAAKQGKMKAGLKTLYDAEKEYFFADRNLKRVQREEEE